MRTPARLICVFALAAGVVCAQRVSVVVGERGGRGDRGHGERGRGDRPRGDHRRPDSRPLPPLVLDDYYFGYYPPPPPAPPSPAVLSLPAAPPPEPAAPPAPAASPEVKDYSWNASPPPAPKPPVHFALVMKDGAEVDARACWVDGDRLNYVDAAGDRQEVPLARIDRALSAKRNRERGLQLSLP